MYLSAQWSLPPSQADSVQETFYEKGTGSFSFFRGSIPLLRSLTVPIQTFL